jgi:hypothetical protein
MPAKLTTEEFIKKSILKHVNKYDYSKTFYSGSKKKVIIICNIHGEFIQTASDHLSGCGCPKCDPTKSLGSYKFIEKSIEIHGNKYDYSKVRYGKNNYDLVEIMCKDHGSFTQRPWAHLRGQGCPDCSNNKLITNKEFIEKSIEMHGNKYDYTLTNYSGRRKYVNIICKKHGVFKQLSRLHLEGYGCKKCKTSKLEDYLTERLIEIKEPFERDKKFKDCKNKKPLPFDFYLPIRNMLIECDGIQHRKPINHFGGEERFEYQKNNDNIKTKWCEKRKIKLNRVKDKSEIDKLINEIKEKEIPFDKSILKDTTLDRIKPVKIDDSYLSKTDFNWYRERDIKSEISSFIKSLGVTYESDNIIDWIIDNNHIILIDNFSDCEINKNKNWLVKLKDELEESNINLIVIYPEKWILNSEIIKSRIRNILRLNEFRIGARDCEIIIPDNKSVFKFLNENHIQGHVNSSIKIALRYNNEIVSLITFGKLRKNLGQKSKEGSYELIRFCNKRGYTVSGSSSKLMRYFKKEYNPKYILSYADRCWTSIHKNIYKELGFDFVSKTKESYSYLVGDKKYDRYRYRKDKLIEFGYDKDKWTEREICSSNLIFRIFDAGCLKYEIFL